MEHKDVPSNVFPYGIERKEENGYCYFIATREKAICDILYEYKPVFSMKDMEELLFDDLRINEEVFNDLDIKLLIEIASLYKTTNHKVLVNYIRRKYNV